MLARLVLSIAIFVPAVLMSPLSAEYTAVGTGNTSSVRVVNSACNNRLQLRLSASKEQYYELGSVKIDAQAKVYELSGPAPVSEFATILAQQPAIVPTMPSPAPSTTSTEVGTIRLVVRATVTDAPEFVYSGGRIRLNPTYAFLQNDCLCSAGKIFSPSAARCICSSQCAAPLVQDPNTCACNCAATCPAGKVLNPINCSCVCPTTCPGGYTQDASCACVCGTTCQAPKVLDTGSCSCRCPAIACPAGTSLEPTTCTCR